MAANPLHDRYEEAVELGDEETAVEIVTEVVFAIADTVFKEMLAFAVAHGRAAVARELLATPAGARFAAAPVRGVVQGLLQGAAVGGHAEVTLLVLDLLPPAERDTVVTLGNPIAVAALRGNTAHARWLLTLLAHEHRELEAKLIDTAERYRAQLSSARHV